jgi:nucleotide-binding universal stress UspA family protein
VRDIVVGVDGSTASDRALDRALLEAETSGRPVRVVHGWTTPIWSGGVPGFAPNILASPHDSERYAHQLVEEALAKALSRRTSQLPLSTQTEVLEGDGSRVLVKAGADAGLVVLGGRGHGQIAGVLLGSTTNYVLHHATCPVMVVPEPGAPVGRFLRVFVGVDGSPGSRSALAWALDAARRYDCPLIALHAWMLSTVPGWPPATYVTPPTEHHDAEALAWLQGEVSSVVGVAPGVEVRTELVHGTAAAGLMDKAGPDDLLVVGSRGRGGFATLVLGSVATQCARYARGVVTVVRPGQQHLEP